VENKHLEKYAGICTGGLKMIERVEPVNGNPIYKKWWFGAAIAIIFVCTLFGGGLANLLVSTMQPLNNGIVVVAQV
jgi:hypothetical protein